MEKAPKIGFWPGSGPGASPRVTTQVYYNWDQEEQKENKRRDREKAEALVMALQGVNLGASKARGLAQRPMPEACFLCGKEVHFKWECPKAQTTAPRPCPTC